MSASTTEGGHITDVVYVHILHRFRYIVRYWSKITDFWTTVCKKRFALGYRTVVCLSVSITLVYCGQTVA